uniref:Protein kinase domain-containing protein n=1 Tax=Trichobilharzia regenti TaxID=157069 RepID=A0AA85J393_TRIRE|nr:unnamed protein product [Trichobilharzia regenti]
MYSSGNNNTTNPVSSALTLSSLYSGVNPPLSTPRVMPRNLGSMTSFQPIQRNRWDTNKLNSDNVLSSYPMNSNTSDYWKPSGVTSSTSHIYDQNGNNNNKSNNNESGYNNRRASRYEEVQLSVNRRTQPGISAVIKSLAQNLKSNMNGNDDDNNSTDNNDTTYKNNLNEDCKPETFSYFTSHNHSFSPNTIASSSIPSPSTGGDYSLKNTQFNYTSSNYSQNNFGRNFNMNNSNSLNSLPERDSEANIKMTSVRPVQMTKQDSLLPINSSIYNGNELCAADSVYSTNCTTCAPNNKYSPILSSANNYNALLKRSSSTSPYRPLVNYRPLWSVISNQNLLSSELFQNANNNNNESSTSKSKYIDSIISNNSYRSATSRIGTGTQTPASITTTTAGEYGIHSPPPTSILDNNGNNTNGFKISKSLGRNEYLPPTPTTPKPSFYTRLDGGEAGEGFLRRLQQQDDEDENYSKTYYIMRRPQILHSAFQKYRPHMRHHEHRLSYNADSTMTAATTTGGAKEKDSYLSHPLGTSGIIHKKPIETPNISKYNSYLSNNPLSSYKRNSLSLSSLPTDEDCLSSLIQAQCANDDYHARVGSASSSIFSGNGYNNSGNHINTTNDNHLNYCQNHQSSNNPHQGYYQAMRHEQPQTLKQNTNASNQCDSGVQKYNSEMFRSVSVSPDIGRKFPVGSLLIPCRSYNENMNAVALNTTPPSCLSATSSVKRKGCQVTFNLDRNMYVEYPYSESSTSTIQCKRIPGYISSSGAAPGEGDLVIKTAPRGSFNWSNENGITTIAKPINGYHSEYTKQTNYLTNGYGTRPLVSKYNRYSSPPPQCTSNYDSDNGTTNSNNNNNGSHYTSTECSTQNGHTSSKPEIRFIDTTIGQIHNSFADSVNSTNGSKPPVSTKSINNLKSILSKPTFRYGRNTTTNLNSSKQLYRQIEQLQGQDTIDVRQCPAIDILSRRCSLSS